MKRATVLTAMLGVIAAAVAATFLVWSGTGALTGLRPLAIFVGGGNDLAPAARHADPFAGSETCADCHAGQYSEWSASGHPWKLTPAKEAQNRPLPLPEGYSWDDISYVVGGYKWKSRYMDEQGYIITSAGGEAGNNQYNMMTGEWVDYHPGEEKPYNCGRCHTTGYSPDGHEGGLRGVIGTWKFPGIQCEACHGPGRRHASHEDPSLIEIDTSAAACGACHVRGDPSTIPAKGGFIRHHEQYNEHLASPHSGLDCIECHNPHKKAEFSIHTGCADCHSGEQSDFTNSQHDQVGLECQSCHMPMASKSAASLGPYKGDVKTHLFSINTDPAADMFTPDGKFANPFLTLDFACLQCHQNKTTGWAATNVPGIHTLGK